MQPMSSSLYYLSRHCFVCEAQGYWIILNARRDKYYCVTESDLRSIGHRLYGWPADPQSASIPQPENDDALIGSLISNGIITCQLDEGKAFAACGLVLCERVADKSSDFESSKITPLSTLRFLLACAKVDWQLRAKPLDCTLSRIERRQQLSTSLNRTKNSTRATDLVNVFNRLRPFYPRPYLCLFDSLALQEFLAKYRAFPRIVFGVTADPFLAHCWVQEGVTLLNDELERVTKFKPILSV